MVAGEQSPQAVILIPRHTLHYLLGSGADMSAISSLVIDDQKNHPSGIRIRGDLLELMNKVLDFHKPTLTGLPILESAWKLNDMPLYRKAIRYFTTGGNTPKELPQLLATLVTQPPTQ